MIDIKKYDKVLLKSGQIAFITEIFEKGKAYLADVDYPEGTETEDIKQGQIEKIID